jgi:hypothetical protein
MREELWSPWIPEMVGGYFADLVLVLEGLHAALADGNECWIVVGDSSYRDVRVPVADVLAELLSARGWRVKDSTPFRHMKASAQQGWRPMLAESLLILERIA